MINNPIPLIINNPIPSIINNPIPSIIKKPIPFIINNPIPFIISNFTPSEILTGTLFTEKHLSLPVENFPGANLAKRLQ